MISNNQRIKTTLVISFLFVLLSGVAVQSVSAEPECESTVDMADSLDFHRMHMDCNKDKKIGRGKKEAATEKDSSVQNNVKIHEASEPFSVTGGPASAQLGLFTQMAKQCPKGWEKHNEIVTATEQGFYLRYRYSCL